MLALVICFFAIERGHFPGWIAALPVIFTLLVLRYGISGNQWLAHPSLVWIGKLSYPLYLWHWPCLVLLPLVFGQGYVVLLSALIASLCLSYVTYRFVEQPFSYGELNRVVPVLLLVSVVIALCLGGVLMQDKRFLYTVSPNSDAVNLALPLKSESQCQDDAPVENLIFCRRNRELEGVRIALLGDSFSNQYYDGLGEVLLGHDIGLLNFGAPGCAALLEVNSIQTHKDCSASVDALRFAADSDAIDVVVLAGAWYTIKKYRENPAHLANLIDDTLNFLEARGKTVIFVHTLPVHRQKIRKNCVSRSVWQEQPECVVLRSEVDRWRDIVRPDIDKVLARHPGVQIFDPTPFLCDENVCDIRRNGRLLYRDAHLSAYGGEYLGQFLATLIVKSTEVRK